MKKIKILILGGTGMLGHVLLRHLSSISGYEVFATTRSHELMSRYFPVDLQSRFRPGVDADNFDTVIRSLAAIQPDIVINCIGLIKQLPIAGDPLSAITVNAQLPHRLSLVCKTAGARMIHISTDCVYDGKKGNYSEAELSNAEDLYGKTKFLGEVNYPHCITLRTSIIGHELRNGYGLVDWFMAQQSKTRGFTNAVYSGFPTIELAKVISEYVLPNGDLSGTYHVSSEAISKFDLLQLIAKRYGKDIVIEPYPHFVLDRSMDSTRFRRITGYAPPSWDELVDKMFKDYDANKVWYAR